jgi:probable phosphoglycerate mutase
MTTSAFLRPEQGFLFVRHGESTDNAAKRRSGGDVDPMLTAAGVQQAIEVAQQLAMSMGDRITTLQLIAAPLRRTRETARIIATELGMGSAPTCLWEGFRERRLGLWNGLPVDKASQRLIQSGATPPGGESELIFRQRVLETARKAAALADNDTLPLVVSSRGVGRILGWPEMPNAGIFAWPDHFAHALRISSMKL